MTDYLDAIEVIGSSEADVRTKGELERLEFLLRDTHTLVYRRNKQLTCESDIQVVLEDYLSACFPDWVKRPTISGHLKKFIPDGGIRSVRAAIEFKFAIL